MKLAKVSSLVMLFLWIALACNRAATAQPLPVATESRKNELEVRKLELEVAALSDEKHVPVWVTGVLGFLGGVAGTVVTVWGARRARIGALDQAVHEKRIESYAGLVTTSAPLALCFPPGASICPNDCRAMGEAIRAWYFNGGGLLMSTASRDAYFRLARALTRAWFATELRVPIFPDDAIHISVPAVDQYRRDLAGLDIDNVETWRFDGQVRESDTGPQRFRDFVFLQKLTSTLRTELCTDLHSRRRPS